LKSLILAGINEFLEESRGITLPHVAPGPRRRRRRRQRCWVHAILQVGIESTPKRKGADSILSENASRWRRGNRALDAANEIIKMSTPCISDDESRYQRRQAQGRKLIHTRHLAYFFICTQLAARVLSQKCEYAVFTAYSVRIRHLYITLKKRKAIFYV